jgi:hypothetical protein
MFSERRTGYEREIKAMPLSKIITLAALTLLTTVSQHALAQDRRNFAYISPNAGSSSVLRVAKDASIFKNKPQTIAILKKYAKSDLRYPR